MINVETKKLIVFYYPFGAGGKFISRCLTLHPKVLLQDKDLVKSKLKNYHNENMNFKIAMAHLVAIEKRNSHIEDSTLTFSGFNSKNLKENINGDKDANPLFHILTNQDDYYFIMMQNLELEKDLFINYPNKKQIILTNYEKVHKARHIKLPKENIIKTDNSIEFDMNSINNDTLFANEIEKTFTFLGLKIENYEYIEKLRIKFLKTYTIGFAVGKEFSWSKI